MPRATNNPASRERRKKILKLAKGSHGSRHRQNKMAQISTVHAGVDAYRDRKARKRDFRQLWIARISAGARAHGITYSRFISGLKLAKLDINRKMLAEIAATDDAAFALLVEQVKAALVTAS